MPNLFISALMSNDILLIRETIFVLKDVKALISNKYVNTEKNTTHNNTQLYLNKTNNLISFCNFIRNSIGCC